MKILLIGQTTLHWGRMEFGNIGNYYIIEPFIRELHSVFPNVTIKTTLQMSDEFCQRENIQVLPMSLYYGFSDKELSYVKNELDIVKNYLITGKFEFKTPYIGEVFESDIVIDFSGDIWGDNADFLGKDRFEVGLYKDLIAQKLGKPTFMIAGSPGPFNNAKTKKLAKEVFKNFSLVTNRESISTELLKKDGFDVNNVKSLSCPAFLFEPNDDNVALEILKKYNLPVNGKPLIGFIICGWNFLGGPFDKWPRTDDEYTIFAEVIEHLSDTINGTVCLLSHSNGFKVPPNKFEMIHGRDYPILKQLNEVIKKRGIAKNVVLFDGIYDPWTTKAIIKHFDLLVSGRVHGAVAGLSQSVPTVVIDYGHEPKAHKLRGFTRVVEMEDFLVDPKSSSEIIEKINICWKEKENIKHKLNQIIPEVKNLARQNFTLIKQYLHENQIDF